jgi:hypothetical protein
MALKLDLGEANAGRIVCVQVDGVDISALRALVLAHPHVLTLDSHSESQADLPVKDWGANPININVGNAQSGGSWLYTACAGAPRAHGHAQGTMAVASTTATTALSAKTDGRIRLLPTGEIICDLIDGYAPEVMYDRYDGHTHTVGGVPANHTYPALQAYRAGDSDYEWFNIATDNSGTGATVQRAYTHEGTSSHTISSASLAAYNAPAGGGSDGSAALRIACDEATGYISLERDVNDIGIAEFYADYLAHTHTPSATVSTQAASTAQLFGENGDSYQYFQVLGNWLRMNVHAAAHNHSLLCGVPS